MEADKNIFPQMDLLPIVGKIEKAGAFLLRLLRPTGSRFNTGAAPALDRAIFEGEEDGILPH